MRPTLVLTIAAMVTALASAKPPQAPPVRFVRAVCDCGGDVSRCTCGPDCDCPGCAAGKATSPGPVEYALYLAQYERALRANKALLIWVGETCPAYERKWTQYVHARLSEFGGPDWSVPTSPETGPEVIVARPDGLGGMTIVGRLQGIPTVDQVAVLAQQGIIGDSRTSAAATCSQLAPPPDISQPIFFPAMPQMMFGGGGMMTGGGFGGGGGGGC